MAKSTTARGYGHMHQQRRKRWAAKVRQGTVCCARCGLTIEPGEKWHLDHADDRNGYLGPSHARCNLEAAAAKTNSRMPHKHWEFSTPVENIGRSLAEIAGWPAPTFGSRHWCPSDGFDPKACRDCHERGSACDAVLAYDAARGAA
jgi:hypothetical protein